MKKLFSEAMFLSELESIIKEDLVNFSDRNEPSANIVLNHAISDFLDETMNSHDDLPYSEGELVDMVLDSNLVENCKRWFLHSELTN